MICFNVKLTLMKYLFSIVSIIAVFNLGTHVQLVCETPRCDVAGTTTCACDMDSHQNGSSCCTIEIKCVTQHIDGALEAPAKSLSQIFSHIQLSAAPQLILPESQPKLICKTDTFLPRLISASQNLPLII